MLCNERCGWSKTHTTRFHKCFIKNSCAFPVQLPPTHWYSKNIPPCWSLYYEYQCILSHPFCESNSYQQSKVEVGIRPPWVHLLKYWSCYSLLFSKGALKLIRQPLPGHLLPSLTLFLPWQFIFCLSIHGIMCFVLLCSFLSPLLISAISIIGFNMSIIYITPGQKKNHKLHLRKQQEHNWRHLSFPNMSISVIQLATI